ncbi:MAG: DNA primase [Okeania sp. SIO2H7]|nr:DNA primase [Okeania sp. SIO2H7]
MKNFRIHPDTIEEVKERTDIYDIISDRVVLRKRGKDFVGLCPFHDEKTPSFTVSTNKQMYYCFGCGAGGNAVKFLMELNKSSFKEVVLELAKRYQIPIKAESPEKHQEFQKQMSLREQLYEILALTTSFYQHALRQPQGKTALEYLLSSRQLREETIVKFQLGYAPNGWETIYGYLVEQKGFPVELVEKAGLILPRKTGGGYYDRFRNRLIIPIHDLQGRVIGFGGRSLGDEQPKYLNSPETELFDKGKTLFALDKAKTAISKEDKAVVVEGYFDAIALHAAGISNAIASLGTALSLFQVRQLLRYTDSKQVILNFDADKAGIKATDRAIGEVEKLAYGGEVQLRVLNLPEGKDADDFLKAFSAEKYRELLAETPLWIDWQIEQLISVKDLKKADEYAQVTKDLVNILTKITNDNQLTYYLQYCADILSQANGGSVSLLTENLLTQVVRNWKKMLVEDEYLSPPLLVENHLKSGNRFRSQPLTKQKKQSSPAKLSESSQKSLLEETEALLLRIYLHQPRSRQEVKDALEARDLAFNLSHHRFLWRQIFLVENLHKEYLEINPEKLISKLQDSCLEEAEILSQVEHLFHLNEMGEKQILRSPLQVRCAVALLEQIMCEKRRDFALKMWKETNYREEISQQYSEQFSAENVWIKELKRLRDTTFYDLVTVPLSN